MIVRREKIQMQVGTLWVIVGSLVIAIGSLLVYYGSKLNQDVSEQKIMTQQKKSEIAIRNDIGELKKELANSKKINDKKLSFEFPTGYQLFGVIDKQIISYEKPSSEKVTIDWSTAKILNITKDYIEIRLPDAILPGNNFLESNVVEVKNQEGFTTQGFMVINGWTPFVTILKSDRNKVIAALGYKKIKQ
jgi:hypothetical protein